MSFDIYDVLEVVRKRPGMYIGEETLENLRAYLAGYSMAMRDLKVLDKSEPNFAGFYDWAAKECGGRSAPYGWGNMILAVSLGDDPENVSWENYSKNVTREQHSSSIRYFYTLLDQYKSDNCDA